MDQEQMDELRDRIVGVLNSGNRFDAQRGEAGDTVYVEDRLDEVDFVLTVEVV